VSGEPQGGIRTDAVVRSSTSVIGALGDPLIGAQGSPVHTLPGEPDLAASFYDDGESCNFKCDTAAREAERSTEASPGPVQSALVFGECRINPHDCDAHGNVQSAATRRRVNIVLAVALLVLLDVGGFTFICAADGRPQPSQNPNQTQSPPTRMQLVALGRS
jgi:hypothetical protein